MKKRWFFLIIYVFILIHFIKDVTQDVLKVATPLDLLGDVKEDVSRLPKVVGTVFMNLGYLSFVAEIFLLVAIPMILLEKGGAALKKSVWIVLSILLIYFALVIPLDPRFRIL